MTNDKAAMTNFKAQYWGRAQGKTVNAMTRLAIVEAWRRKSKGDQQ
jgi:hypothetical protein